MVVLSIADFMSIYLLLNGRQSFVDLLFYSISIIS
ncbi:hypothetical protein Patl1_33763 [Pistacia atlantica]|uniref:Uncharacterized protein n=1 Tax=Pistacia atlantica TaxID=434234 RepID=A0ACC0ZUU5_9ROSI|nr:hypothetical protein Patl1_33763 [Pistacia atlantica]